MLYWCFSQTSLRTHWKTCFTGVCWVNFTQNTLKKHALLVFLVNFTQNTLKNMLYWCLLSRTSLRTHWKTCFTGVCWVELHSEHTEKTCFTGVCWVELHSEHTEKTCFTGVWVELHSEHTEKHALLVFVESNFTQNTLKNMLYWCLLSRTSLRTHWKTCFTGVLVKLHSEHTENMLYWCFSQTSLRTHWKTCFTGVCWVELHSEHTEKHALLVFVVKLHSEHTEKHALLVF